MGLGKFTAEWKYENRPVNPEAAKVADEVFPDLMKGDKAPDYRLAILREFLNRDGLEPKPGRTQDETRYDRAVRDLAPAYDVDGKGTLAGCALDMYATRDGATEQFINDLREIETRLNEEDD